MDFEHRGSLTYIPPHVIGFFEFAFMRIEATCRRRRRGHWCVRHDSPI